MAKYEVECTSGISEECEGEFRVDLYGRRSQREWKLENYDWTCDACKAEQRRRENERSAEANAERGLPELEGSDKQIGWAETIRAGKMEEIDEVQVQIESAEPSDEDQRVLKGLLLEEVAAVRRETSAGAWIDRRDRHFGRLIKRRAKRRFDAGEQPRSKVETFVRTRLDELGLDEPDPDYMMQITHAWMDEAGLEDVDQAREQVHAAIISTLPER